MPLPLHKQHGLHFLLIGIALYAASIWWMQRDAQTVPDLTPDEVAALEQDFYEELGEDPTDDQLERLRQQALDARILIAEALRLGLYRNDQEVLDRLQLDAQFLGIQGDAQTQVETVIALGLAEEDPAIQGRLAGHVLRHYREPVLPPDNATLEAMQAANPERWQQPARWTLEQLAFTQADAQARAQQAITTLSQAPEDDTVSSDTILPPRQQSKRTAAQLIADFGPDFVAALPLQRTEGWIGPLPSRYGVHLVRVRDYNTAQQLPPEAIHDALLQQHARQVRLEQNARTLAMLRARYRIIQP